jgi:hypothetical protein
MNGGRLARLHVYVREVHGASESSRGERFAAGPAEEQQTPQRSYSDSAKRLDMTGTTKGWHPRGIRIRIRTLIRTGTLLEAAAEDYKLLQDPGHLH